MYVCKVEIPPWLVLLPSTGRQCRVGQYIVGEGSERTAEESRECEEDGRRQDGGECGLLQRGTHGKAYGLGET